jgi:glycerol-3-phosphate dehydrogenase
VARDAALRGMTVALVERGDWASGTSSNSLRIVHGGLRYLQHLDIKRMRESIRERSSWLRLAPHLVDPLPVLIPTYGHGLRSRALMRAALAVNDIVSWDRNDHLHPDRRLGPGRGVSRRECLELVPELETPGLTGGVLLHDAQMYSSERLVLETVIGASECGAIVANYVEVSGPLRRNGRLEGVRARDRAETDGRALEIRARTIVNAAGPGAPSVTAGLLDVVRPATSGYTVAVNVGVESTGHEVAFAIAARSNDPNAVLRRGTRQLFVVPWRGRTLIGTAHLPFTGDPAAFRLDETDVATFLAEVNDVWPGADWKRSDLRIVHGGLVPGTTAGDGPVRLDKHHRIIDHARDGCPSLFTAVSVKFTTGRLLAEETVDRVCARLGRRAVGRSSDTPLPGAPDRPVSELCETAKRAYPDVEPRVVAHLVRTHGRRYDEVMRIARTIERPGALVPIDPTSPTVFAQFVHAARSEMGLTPDDLLHRRTELGAVGCNSAAARSLAEEALALEAGRRSGMAGVGDRVAAATLSAPRGRAH